MYISNMNCLMHVIQDGDTLYSLSRRYNVPISTLFRANPYVEVYNLQIGSELCIPVQEPLPPFDFEVYVIENEESLNDILERFDLSYEELIQFNNNIRQSIPNQALQPGTTLQIPIYR